MSRKHIRHWIKKSPSPISTSEFTIPVNEVRQIHQDKTVHSVSNFNQLKSQITHSDVWMSNKPTDIHISPIQLLTIHLIYELTIISYLCLWWRHNVNSSNLHTLDDTNTTPTNLCRWSTMPDSMPLIYDVIRKVTSHCFNWRCYFRNCYFFIISLLKFN